MLQSLLCHFFLSTVRRRAFIHSFDVQTPFSFYTHLLFFVATYNGSGPRNCIEIFEAGAMPMLIKGMESNVEGLRGATAQTCRNIYVLGNHTCFLSQSALGNDTSWRYSCRLFVDLKYRADFKKHGGIQALVKLLDLYVMGDKLWAADVHHMYRFNRIYWEFYYTECK